MDGKSSTCIGSSACVLDACVRAIESSTVSAMGAAFANIPQVIVASTKRLFVEKRMLTMIAVVGKVALINEMMERFRSM